MNRVRFDQGKNVARGIAALLVCIDHAFGFFLEPYFGSASVLSQVVTVAAHQSVMVFFAISGFLITKSILANLDRNAVFSLRDYIFSRVARVYPPLVFSVILTCVLYLFVKNFGLAGSGAEFPYRLGTAPLMREVFTVSLVDVVRALTMGNGMLLANGPLWSLCIEWWIYIVIGVTVFTVSVRGLMNKVLWVTVLWFAASRLYSVNTHAMFYFGIWLFGGGLALANYRMGFCTVRNSGAISGLLAAISLLFWMEPELILSGGRVFGWRENAAQFVVCIFWCALILPDQRVGASLGSRVLFRLGECSFSLYITHFPLLLFMLSVLQSAFGSSLEASILATPVAVILSVSIAHLSALYFEDKDRFLRLIRTADEAVSHHLRKIRVKES